MQSLKFWILFFIAGVYADTVCETYGVVYTYCKTGTYCCNNNKDCCSVLGVGAIVGIVIGVVVAIASCVVCCCCCHRRRQAQGQLIQQQNHMIVAAVNQQNTNVAAPQYPAQYPAQAQYPYQAYNQGQQPAPTAYPPAYN